MCSSKSSRSQCSLACTVSSPVRALSAPGLGSPLSPLHVVCTGTALAPFPHLHRDWAQRLCTGACAQALVFRHACVHRMAFCFFAAQGRTAVASRRSSESSADFGRLPAESTLSRTLSRTHTHTHTHSHIHTRAREHARTHTRARTQARSLRHSDTRSGGRSDARTNMPTRTWPRFERAGAM